MESLQALLLNTLVMYFQIHILQNATRICSDFFIFN